ncbi:MAG: tellurium resistance protein TerC [Myxococcales bacterium]|nr:tellurium resistance protein TerC [Myxococcales bacterium]
MHISDFATLGMLVLLQAVLGFDNLLYISLESKRAPKESQTRVRKIGISIAIGLRIGLLFALVQLIKYVQEPLFHVDLGTWMDGAFSVHSLIVLGGGVFIIYTALKEIWHMMALEHEAEQQAEPSSERAVISMIVVMNLVFSFDSILSAMALTDVFWVMATAIVIGGVLMMWLADGVSSFLQKNRTYEVLGLFVLFIVGIMLVSEGGHIAHLHFFESAVTPMSKTTFYFVIGILVVTDLVQTKYQKNLMAMGHHDS